MYKQKFGTEFLQAFALLSIWPIYYSWISKFNLHNEMINKDKIRSQWNIMNYFEPFRREAHDFHFPLCLKVMMLCEEQLPESHHQFMVIFY